MAKEFLLKCFGRTKENGSIAMVLLNGIMSPEQKLRFTQMKNVPACVFVDEKQQELAGIKSDLLLLDFYYDYGQSPLCIHATLAAGYVYFQQNNDKTKVSAITALGQRLLISKQDGNIYVTLCPMPVPRFEFTKDFIADLLAMPSITGIKNYYLASVGSPKLCVELDSIEHLFSLNPNLAQIMLWSKNNKISGLYVYVQIEGNAFVGRNFNNYTPDKEDVATGVSAGALTAYYQRNLTVYQGQNFNNHCVIYTQYTSDNQILVGGYVEDLSGIVVM